MTRSHLIAENAPLYDFGHAVELYSPLLLVLVTGFVVSLLATPLMRRLAMANGIVDWPDAKRKAHAHPVAYLGGVAIFIGWLCGVLLYLGGVVQAPTGSAPFPVSVILGAAVIMLTGLFDDVYGIQARVKIGGQLFAAAALATENVGLVLVQNTFELIQLGNMPDWLVYWLGTAVIAGLVVGACNAMNLIDGLDGLSSGIAGIAALGMCLILFFFGALVDRPEAGAIAAPIMVICFALIGSLLGFLPYNFNPASIFMGDTGSLLLGFICVAVILMFGGIGGLGPLMVTAGLICFAVPITDTTLAIIRRKLQGRPIFAPDAMHIHHMLRRSGLGVKQAVGVMWGMGLLYAAIGVTIMALQLRWREGMAAFAVLYVVTLLIGLRTAFRQTADLKKKAAEALPEAPVADADADQPGTGKADPGAAAS
ncbi:MAG: MraY family glycosyltransferase [Planctomycetota bacterium]